MLKAKTKDSIEKGTSKAKKEVKEAKKVKKLSQREYETMILELAGKGLTSEKIGEELRKKGIHPKEYEKKISKILGDKYVDPELQNIQNKLEKINKHVENNKQDKRAMREKSRVFSQLRKIKKYLN